MPLSAGLSVSTGSPVAPVAPGGPSRPRPPAPAPAAPPGVGSVPRFGPGSKAQRFPWLLPLRPAASGVAADEARLGDLVVRAASVVGPGHRCQEPATARQDAYRIARDASGEFLLLAVADGVSSSSHAELGAAVAAATAVNVLRQRLDEPDRAAGLSAVGLFEEAAAAMEREAARRGLHPSDVCAVLLVAVVPARPTGPSGERTAWAAWVGDTSLWRLGERRWHYAAGDRKGPSGGYESNAVLHTLPADPHAAREAEVELRAGDAVSLVSDGVGDGLAGLDDLNAYLAERWRLPLPVAAYIDDVGYDAERFLDDRTAITVWVEPGAPATARDGGPGGWSR
ncbi:protein phosphatase 2C domain-containing protein [Streptomyces sp. NPDC096205]|uniref:protein phosphatase 2C domain-containing protein n=1 Tax=Streptomyces sp. NPDC096205 TaxID=3366081 RepID=UPI00380E36BE